VLIERGELDEAAAVLDAVKPDMDLEARLTSLRAALAFARAAATGANDAELKARLAANPADHEARLALAALHAGARRYREALDDLLEIVRADRNWKEGEARKQILAIFNLAEQQSDLVSEYRRKLASALN
jgi:putative thioredoxin